ncbi:MAG: hypothetical protein P0Y53_08995 [Candidatus Pseudobacter hemicellulosilyticus]|uniref:Tetratricopeptide repeat protein n=1 Tax=Candidatus Pseudobacter hemicellulosilyticus TaxID=3121375 RepID=A0AAJ6BHV7_9BACT|nr:MAG: hypothetical protein P0Y53_08995 [Pseudobacter sp.]
MKLFLRAVLTNRILLLLAILVLPCLQPAGQAQQTFDFNPACRQAYKEIMQLRLAEGQRLLDAEKQQHPHNLIPYLLENYIDFFTLFFNEDPAAYKARFPNRDKRLDLMAKGPSDSPFYLYAKSVIHFQWAVVRIKFGYRWDAGWEFRRSFLQAKENMSSHPSFSPNALYNGAMQVAAGTIPDGYKWLGNLLGIKGNIAKGMQRVEQFVKGKDEWQQLFHEEAVFYYCYLQFYVQNNKTGAVQFIRDQQLDVVNNHLFAYLAANLGLNSQQGEYARRVIEQRNTAPVYLSMPVWDLQLGYAKVQHMEPDAADHLLRFVQQFKGKFYVKDALQKVSWYYYLQGNQAKADQYRKELLSSGNTDSEADKQAQQEAKAGHWPNKLLLEARLLNDGGYFRDALRLLHGKTLNDFALPEEKLEFAYRVGRIYDDIGVDNDAIHWYQQAVTLGEQRKEHFAARAALQLGNIYEQKKLFPAAIAWYERCMAMPDHDYKNSLDQRAKAGVARCKGQ